MHRQNKNTWFGVIALIAIEQFIKIIINSRFLDKTYPILAPYLYFEPLFNRHYSWFNSMLNLGISRWLHILLVAVMSIAILLFYKYILKEHGAIRIVNIMFAFVFAGAICSLIDKIFWDGSLDYILVKGLFTFDLKDVYINVFNGLLILSLFSSNKRIQELSERDLLKDFMRYLKGLFKKPEEQL